MTMPTSETVPAPLTLFLFGPMQVFVDGHPLPHLHSRKALSLLALLALRQGRSVERAWLAGTLWPDSEQELAFDNMRPVLSNLRKVLGSQGEHLQSPSRNSLCLELAGVSVDVAVFDAAIARGTLPALEQAVALYRGPLLEGISEEWIGQERDAREQDCLRALGTLADAALGAGNYPQATAYYRRALEVAPLWEAARRGLMESLDRNGDRNAALRIYREFVDLLKADPRAAPDEATSALYSRLRAKARQAAVNPTANAPKAVPEIIVPAVRGYLPHSLTVLIGREEERLEVVTKLRKSRLVTLTGTGGIGKTRLAIEVASEVLPEYPQGVWLVALEALADGAQVVGQVATVLGLKEEAGRLPLDRLTDYLRTRHLLLVLDNCEHLVEASARLAGHLLRECPKIRILATSREALGITGESAWRVPSLAVPDPVHLPQGSATLVRVLLGYESVQLFVARAQAAQKEFTLTGSNASAVAQICAQLEGIPLAIELASARVRVLTVPQIAARLNDHLGLLTGGSRTALSRQQTLRATLDWSHTLLSAPEQILLRRLSIFAGGWSLEAAERICAGEEIRAGQVLDLLGSLADKSLIVFEPGASEGRYRLLEMVRQYTARHLVVSGEAARVGARHRDWYLAFAEEAEPHGNDATQSVWHKRLAMDQDNFRAALSWCLADNHGVEDGLRLAGALHLFWTSRGDLSEGRLYLRAALEREGAEEATASRAKALIGAARLAQNQGDYSMSRVLAEESLTISQKLGDRKGIASALTILGAQAYHQGDYHSAQTLTEESLTIFQELGDPWGIAYALNVLGVVTQSQGNFAVSQAHLEESLSLFQTVGDQKYSASALTNLGLTAQHQGDYALARTQFEESLRIYQEMENKQGIATALNNLVLVSQNQGDNTQAMALLEESLSLAREVGDKKLIASALNMQGLQAYYQADYVSARLRYEESLAISQELGDKQSSAWALNNLGVAALSQEDFTAAQGLLKEGLEVFRELGDKHSTGWAFASLALATRAIGAYPAAQAQLRESILLFQELGQKEGIAVCLEGLAATKCALALPETAVRLWGAAEVIRESIDIPISPGDRKEYDQLTQEARSALGEASYAALWAEGRALTYEQAVAYALEEAQFPG